MTRKGPLLRARRDPKALPRSPPLTFFFAHEASPKYLISTHRMPFDVLQIAYSPIAAALPARTDWSSPQINRAFQEHESARSRPPCTVSAGRRGRGWQRLGIVSASSPRPAGHGIKFPHPPLRINSDPEKLSTESCPMASDREAAACAFPRPDHCTIPRFRPGFPGEPGCANSMERFESRFLGSGRPLCRALLGNSTRFSIPTA